MAINPNNICVFTLYDGTKIEVSLEHLLSYAGAVGKYRLPNGEWEDVGPAKKQTEQLDNLGIEKKERV